MSRRSGIRFADKDMRQHSNLRRHITVVHTVFTTLLELLFTNAIEMTAQMSALACVWRACIAD
jgi:hypothetical protein